MTPIMFSVKLSRLYNCLDMWPIIMVSRGLTQWSCRQSTTTTAISNSALRATDDSYSQRVVSHSTSIQDGGIATETDTQQVRSASKALAYPPSHSARSNTQHTFTTQRTTMNDALCSILCSVSGWSHEMQAGVCLRFNEDGTGEVCAVGELGTGFVFGVNMKWRSVPRRREWYGINDNQISKHTNPLAAAPAFLGRLQLEITLENSMAVSLTRFGFHHDSNEATLTVAAFLPRLFTVVIERGNFLHEDYVGRFDSCRSALRLTFDVSPYPLLESYRLDRPYPSPPLDEWCRLLNGSRTYLARELPASAANVRATNDDSIAGYRTVKPCKAGRWLEENAVLQNRHAGRAKPSSMNADLLSAEKLFSTPPNAAGCHRPVWKRAAEAWNACGDELVISHGKHCQSRSD
nr:hypothetical protein CFP56_36230 [Quercus suber]